MAIETSVLHRRDLFSAAAGVALGGLIGFGHPVGATGVKQAAEIFRQMKGLCGDYQIQREPRTGLTMNMGGDDRTVVSLVLGNAS